MGGGDLNLKKSWHPNTMKNMERVWKAEQKDTEEKKRIAELQREIIAERDKEDMLKYAEDMGVVKKKDDVKLEWMYKGPSQSLNREDYLLGKAVDKNFEKYNNEVTAGSSAAQDEDSLPGAVRQAKSSMFSEQVDVARKLHEDPLMAIRQRAVEKAKQLYNNPVKMKEIKKMAAAKSLEDEKHGKEKKKKKKSKTSSKHEDDKMLDALLTQKLKSALKDRQLLRKFKKKAHESSSDSSSDSSESASNNETHRHKKKSEDIGGGGRETLHNKDHCIKSPVSSGDNWGRERSNNWYNERNDAKHSRSANQYHSKRSYDQSFKRKSRSRSREKSKARTRKEETRYREGRSGCNYGSSSSRPEKNASFDHRKRLTDRSVDNDMKGKEKYNSKQGSESNDRKRLQKKEVSSSDEGMKNQSRYGKGLSYDAAGSNSTDDSDDGAGPRRKRTFGLMMADGSKPVVKQKSVLKDHKSHSSPEAQKPAPWQKKDRVKLSEEEKERKRNEMMQNASWRDKEREINVKRYRLEEANEKRQLQENFDNDFAMRQLSKATNQTSVEGRIKSKLNTIQRSKMAMDHNFARR